MRPEIWASFFRIGTASNPNVQGKKKKSMLAHKKKKKKKKTPVEAFVKRHWEPDAYQKTRKKG